MLGEFEMPGSNDPQDKSKVGGNPGQPGGNQQHSAVDHAVPTGDDRRRVAGRYQRVGRDSLPAPVSEAGSEDLQERRADEDAGEEAGPRRAEHEPGEPGQAERARHIEAPGQRRQNGESGQGPAGCGG